MFRQRGGASTGIGAGYFTNDGIPIGWSHGFLTPGLMEIVPPTLEDGRLYPDAPAYKAVALMGDRLAGQEKTIPLAAAKRLLALAQQGLKVVIVGDWSQARSFGLSSAAEDAEVRDGAGRAARRCRASRPWRPTPTSRPASPRSGSTRTVEHATSTLMHVHRVDGDVDYFYVANARHAENRRINPVSQDVWFTTTDAGSVPYLMNAWTGDVRRLAVYERAGDRVQGAGLPEPGRGHDRRLRRPEVAGRARQGPDGRRVDDRRRAAVRRQRAGRALGGGRRGLDDARGRPGAHHARSKRHPQLR